MIYIRSIILVLVASSIFASCADKPRTVIVEPIFYLKPTKVADEEQLNDNMFLSDSLDIDKIIKEDMVLTEPNLSLYNYMFEQNKTLDDIDYYKEIKEFNVPVVMTARVLRYIDYFTKRVPHVTQRWLDRSNKYMYIVEDIFLKEGLPSDLTVLAFVESGFNNHAISRAGATGMWQFMSSTGKIYGLNYDFWIDERKDFEVATTAAARFLKDLHDRFGDWYLALASYNAGPGRISSASRKHKTDDFFEIAKKRTLALETRDYVPKFIALLIIYKNYLKFGFKAPDSTPLTFSVVELPTQVNLYWLAKKLDIDVERLVELNPSLKLPITPPMDNYRLRVPFGDNTTALEAINSSTADERLLYSVYYAKAGESIDKIAGKFDIDNVNEVKKINGLNENFVRVSRPLFLPIEGITDPEINKDFVKALERIAPSYYKVKKGDTFSGIARKHGYSTNTLRKLNPNISVSRLRIGQMIIVARGVSAAAQPSSYSRSVKKAPKPKSTTTRGSTSSSVIRHKVRAGESLSSIADKYNVKINNIKIINNLKSDNIQVGMVLSIGR